MYLNENVSNRFHSSLNENAPYCEILCFFQLVVVSFKFVISLKSRQFVVQAGNHHV